MVYVYGILRTPASGVRWRSSRGDLKLRSVKARDSLLEVDITVTEIGEVVQESGCMKKNEGSGPSALRQQRHWHDIAICTAT
jgi:hypothetical protein